MAQPVPTILLCPPATSEDGARRPRSSANYNDSSTNLLTSTNDHMIRGWGLDWFLPKGSYQKVPSETFLQKKVPAKKAPETQRYLPKRSCQKGSWKYRSWAIRFLSTRLPGPYGSCQKHSHVHMVPRSKWFPISVFKK
jgi:hypothetical protein